MARIGQTEFSNRLHCGDHGNNLGFRQLVQQSRTGLRPANPT
jgi:hypothetical protein